MSHHLEQLEQFLEEAPREIARRRSAGSDVIWLVDAVAELQELVPALRQFVAARRVIDALRDGPGSGLQFDELAEQTGLPPDRLAAVLHQLQAAGLLGS